MKRCAGHTHGILASAVVSFVSFVILFKCGVQYNYDIGKKTFLFIGSLVKI